MRALVGVAAQAHTWRRRNKSKESSRTLHMPLGAAYAPQIWATGLPWPLVKLLRFFADALFASRYGHRAIVLETVAGACRA